MIRLKQIQRGSPVRPHLWIDGEPCIFQQSTLLVANGGQHHYGWSAIQVVEADAPDLELINGDVIELLKDQIDEGQ